MNKPNERLVMRHTHDCNDCIPLGQYLENDLYYCRKGPRHTVIARFGSDGPEYTSGFGLVSIDKRLHIANEMAKAAGYIN